MDGAALKLHQPVPREVVLRTDRQWEGNMCHYPTVLRDGDLCRMYYCTWHADLRRDTDGKACLTDTPIRIACVESLDGVHWHRPEYGLCEVDGSTRNNVVWTGEGGRHEPTHGFAPFIDTNPNCSSDQRYKALVHHGPQSGKLWAMVSPDGLRWRLLRDEPIITGFPFDSQNLAFFDTARGEYRAYIRDFSGPMKTQCRGIRTATSSDFVTWTDPEWLEFSDGLEQQLYTNQIMPYPRAPHNLVGFPTRYTERTWSPAIEALPEPEHRRLRADVEERYGAAVTDGLFMSSRDGKTFNRWSEAFLRPGPQTERSWAYGDTYQSWGLIETESNQPSAPPELSLYATEGYWRGNSTVFRRYTIRTDGFVSVNAAFSGGEFLTSPLTFAGSRLALNISTSGAGRIQVEIQRGDGSPIEGFALSDCHDVIGDELERTVSWHGGADVSRLVGTPIRLRFALSDADLYAMRFAK